MKHALEVRKAIQTENYHRFSLLYNIAPNMGSYIMDMIMNTQRIQAITKICKAYLPSISLDFVKAQLGFDNIKDAESFLLKVGCKIVEESVTSNMKELVIMTKETTINTSVIFTKDKLLL